MHFGTIQPKFIARKSCVTLQSYSIVIHSCTVVEALLSNIRLSTNWRRKPFSIDPDSEIEKTIIKLQICANYGKILLIKAPQTYFSHLLSNTLLFIY